MFPVVLRPIATPDCRGACLVMIECQPMGICSWNFRLNAPGWQATLFLRTWTEQGEIKLGDRHCQVRKHGLLSGRWTLTLRGQTLFTAQKRNAFTRNVTITGPGISAELVANSLFSRRMNLSGPDIGLRIEPCHPFTRRATISGICPDPALACFAFWLTAVAWRRARKNSGSAGS